jgi:hypothetical protein
MGSPFTITSVSNYNSNPPSDDGSQTAANRVQWSTQKTKLADPVYNAFNSSETATSAAFGKVVGGAGITTTAVSYTVTSSDQGKFVKATASAITITTPDATVVGTPFVFAVLNNSSGDVTFAGNGTQTIDGLSTTTIPAGCGLLVNTDGSNWFSGGQNFPNNTQGLPQGRLTLTSGAPVLASDVSAATSILYTPYKGDLVPVSINGTTFQMRQFAELTLTLTTNHLANTLYDVFIFDNSGTLTLGTGPAWSGSAAGSSARGSGAGTTEIARVNGLLVNKNSMTARNGSTTYTVAANEGTYLGTFITTGSAGTTAMVFNPAAATGGTNNLLGVYNAYNRRPIRANSKEASTSWSYTLATIRSLDNSASNRISYVDGLGEEYVGGGMSIRIATAAVSGALARAGIGRNKTTGFDFDSYVVAPSASGGNAAINPNGIWTPSLGFNYIQAMEASDGTNASTFVGGGTETYLFVNLEM